MDIHEGDLLTIASVDYPIKSCADWTMSRQSASSFNHMAVLSASTKRSGITGSIRTAPVTNLSNLKATPLDPVSAELAATVETETPSELTQTFVTDGAGFVHLILEVLK